MYYRLKKSSDFTKVFKIGKKVYSKSLMMIYLKGTSITKVGFAVNKKHGKSVKRNRIKRLLRVAFFENSKFIKENCYFVFLPKENDEYTLKTFLSDMKDTLKKAGLIDD